MRITSSVVMTVYNRVDLTASRMQELARLFNIRKDFELIVIDNGSTDNTAHILYWWKHNAGDWRCITRRLKKNIGFGPAINKAAKMARGANLFIISNDVKIEGDFIRTFVDYIEENDDNVIASPRIIDWPAGWNEFPPNFVIPYAEGWLLAMRKRVWNELEGFDPLFAPYDYEDIDLSYKAQRQGVRLVKLMMPAVHMGGATIGHSQERMEHTKNQRKKFAEKWGMEWSEVR